MCGTRYIMQSVYILFKKKFKLYRKLKDKLSNNVFIFLKNGGRFK